MAVFFLPVPSRYTGGQDSRDYDSQKPERISGHVDSKPTGLVGGGPAGAPQLSVSPGARGPPLAPRPRHGARGGGGVVSPRVWLRHVRGLEEDEQAPGNGVRRGGRARGPGLGPAAVAGSQGIPVSVLARTAPRDSRAKLS